MTTSDPATMKLADVLANYRDGDEHGWDVEFDLLRSTHAAKLDMLATSIQETGMHTPILLGSDGNVWDGHHRLCVASMLGMEDVPVEHATSNPTPELPAHSGHEFGGAYARLAALAGGDPDWMDATGGDPTPGDHDLTTDELLRLYDAAPDKATALGAPAWAEDLAEALRTEQSARQAAEREIEVQRRNALLNYGAYVQAHRRAEAAEERERVLIAGVREVADSARAGLADTDDEDDFEMSALWVLDRLSRLLPSTPTEEGKQP